MLHKSIRINSMQQMTISFPVPASKNTIYAATRLDGSWQIRTYITDHRETDFKITIGVSKAREMFLDSI